MTAASIDIRPARTILLVFVISSVLSFVYALSGQYGGDYLGQEVTIGSFLLLLNLFLNLLPYYLFWRLYKRFRFKPVHKSVVPLSNPVFLFLIVFFLYTVITIVLFGVGRMEADVYEAPAGLKLIIQLTNRLSFLYIALFYMLINRSLVRDLVVILMILAHGFLTAGLGSLMYIFFVMLVKYYDFISTFLRRNLLIVLTAAFIFPVMVNELYQLRDRLRNSESVELNTFDLFFGKLAGRLSSYPNSAVIIQEPAYFVIVAATLDSYYFQIQAIKALFGGDYREKRPELFMKGVYNDMDQVDVNSAFMTSTPGNLIISLLKSPFNCLLNIINIYLYILVIFWLVRLLRFRYNYEFAFILTIYPLTSGVSNEYVTIITSLLFLVLLCVFYHSVFRKSEPKSVA